MWCGILKASGADPWTPIQRVMKWRDTIEERKRKARWKEESERLALKAAADLEAVAAEEENLESEVRALTS